MGSYPVAVLVVHQQVGDLMDQRIQECIRVEVAVDRDPVILSMDRITVIPKYGTSFTGHR